jgi:hypothetical protein
MEILAMAIRVVAMRFGLYKLASHQGILRIQIDNGKYLPHELS